ncbi:MAG: patatin-like phospholipase family protein [Clostridiaceae bacterium]
MKIGIVLAGGGGKGAYQVGVWKGLRELGIDKYISVVSGTSIGALNAALFAMDDYNAAEEIWLNITRDKVLPVDNLELITKGIKLLIGNKNINFIKKFTPKLLEQGNVSREGLLKLLNQYIDFNKLMSISIPAYATCTELPDIKARYFKLNNYDEKTVINILCATSAIPSIYESVEIEGRKYVDGGMVDNIPVQPVYGEGCDIIFILHLNNETIIDRNLYPNSRIIQIVPSSTQGGVFSGVLDFSRESIKKRIAVGYEDTMNLIAPLLEIGVHKTKMAPLEAVSSAGKKIVTQSKQVGADLFTFYKKNVRRG